MTILSDFKGILRIGTDLFFEKILVLEGKAITITRVIPFGLPSEFPGVTRPFQL